MRFAVPLHSLRAKVLASAIAGVLIISVFTSLYYPYRQRQAALASMRDRSATLAASLAMAAGIGMEHKDYDEVAAAVEWVTRDSTLKYVVVLDSVGSVFASYNPRNVKIDSSAIHGRTGLTETADAIRVAVPVAHGEQRQGTLFLEMSLRPVHAQIARDRRAALIISVLSVGLGLVLAAIFSSRITAPLVALREAADRVSGGEYQMKEIPAGDDEVGALASAFNLMTREIGASIDQLKRQAAELADARDQAVESASKYRLLFDANPKPMWVFDTETLRFTAVNESAIRHYGYRRDEFLAMTVMDIRSEDEAARLEDVLQDLTSTTSPSNWHHQKKDGTRIEVEISSDAIELDGRKARLVLSHDVTDRKRLEEQYRQAQKMEAVGQLAGGIAHDFNNILTVILAVSGMLIADEATPRGMIEEIEEIRKAAQRAAVLTSQLLAFSRKQVLTPQILALNEVVRGMDKMLLRLLGEDIEFRVGLADDLKHVRADRGQIEQVIMNLAVNARDAMPLGGELTIETSNAELNGRELRGDDSVQRGHYVLLSVSDTGTGMSAETQAHLFEPFFTTKEPGRGTGLGLATVYGIVQQTGGHVTVHSEPEQGSTFKIYLPSTAQPIEVIESCPVPGPLRGTETILVVEDEEAVRRLTTRILREHGYSVLASRSGPDALERVKYSSPIHLLVTDVVMPGMNGRELSERLRSVVPRLKVLFVSGYTNDTIMKHGILEPGIEFLAKPFTVIALARKVRIILDS